METKEDFRRSKSEYVEFAIDCSFATIFVRKSDLTTTYRKDKRACAVLKVRSRKLMEPNERDPLVRRGNRVSITLIQKRKTKKKTIENTILLKESITELVRESSDGRVNERYRSTSSETAAAYGFTGLASCVIIFE
jgi:hypothetical protein